MKVLIPTPGKVGTQTEEENGFSAELRLHRSRSSTSLRLERSESKHNLLKASSFQKKLGSEGLARRIDYLSAAFAHRSQSQKCLQNHLEKHGVHIIRTLGYPNSINYPVQGEYKPNVRSWLGYKLHAFRLCSTFIFRLIHFVLFKTSLRQSLPNSVPLDLVLAQMPILWFSSCCGCVV